MTPGERQKERKKMMNVFGCVGHKKGRKSRKRKLDEWEEELCKKRQEKSDKRGKKDFPEGDKWSVL